MKRTVIMLFAATAMASLAAFGADWKCCEAGEAAGLDRASIGRKLKNVVALRYGRDVRDEILADADRAFSTHFDDDRNRKANDPWMKPEMGAWQGEFWGKYMLAGAEVAEHVGDEELKTWLREKAVDFVRRYQQGDGYLCSYADREFLGGPGDPRCRFAWNIWGRKYTMWALLEIGRIANAPELVEAARRMADQLIAQLDRRGLSLRETGYFAGLPSCSMLIPMVRLYKATGDRRYLDYAGKIVRDWNREDGAKPNLIRNAIGDKPVHEWYPEDNDWAKAYEMMSCLEGVLEYAQVVGGDEGRRLCEAVTRIRDKLASNEYNEKLGSVGDGDKFRGLGNGGKKGTELCDVVHWMRLNAALYRATGDAKAPEFVLKAYNGAFLAGILDGGRWCMQFVKPDGSGKPADLQVNMKRHHCCVDNMPRGFVVAESMADAVAQASDVARRDYSITVPVWNEPGLEKLGGRERMLEELRKLGASRVNLCLDKYVSDGAKRADVMRALKENSDWFKAHGLSTCAWIWAFWGDDEMLRKFHRITKKNGAPSSFLCPLDEGFRKIAADYVADMARTGVDMILYDDDFAYRNDATGPKVSCLCEKHLAAYRRELGEDISADEFSRRVMTGGRNRWRDVWMKVNGEALLAFAKEMRAAADSVNPKLRLGLCSVMSAWDNDGTDAPTVARALAGPNTRPFLRLIGAPYWAVKRSLYDSRLQNVIEFERMERSWVGEGIEVVAEGDAYPRPRYNCPASYLELFDMAIRADGRMDGIMKYALDYSHHVDYERGYTIRHLRNAKAYDWIMRNMSAKPAVGVRIYESLHKLRDAEIPEGETGTTAIFQQFGSPAGKLIADASIPTVYEGEGVCGAAFGENVKQVPKEAFARGLIVDRRGAELLEEMGVQVGLKEKGADASETFFHENADGGRFFVLNFDTKGPKGRGYDISRTLADAVSRLSCEKLPAYVNGNPDLYLMVKREGAETVVGLWNMFADSVLDGVVELDAPAGEVEFFNCTGRKDGDRVVIDEIPPFAFAGIRILNK